METFLGRSNVVFKPIFVLRASKGIFSNALQFMYLFSHLLKPTVCFLYIELFLHAYLAFGALLEYILPSPLDSTRHASETWMKHRPHEELSLWPHISLFFGLVIILRSLLTRCWQNTAETYAKNQVLHQQLDWCLVSLNDGLVSGSVEHGKGNGIGSELRDYFLLLLP